MNRKELLDLFAGTEDKFIMEVLESPRAVRKPRVLLIAALVTASVLLLGCASAFLWLPELSIGSGIHTMPESTEAVPHQVVSFAGLSDSPASQALGQWRAFRENYDPEGKHATNEPDQPDIPNNYEWVYHCYTQEMTQKLDEITEEFGLKLLDTWVPITKKQSEYALEALGVSSLLREGAAAEMGAVHGMLYPPYNFELSFSLTLIGENATWQTPVEMTAYYCRKDYLPEEAIVWELMLQDFDQWSYTTSEGTEVMLARNQYGLGFLHVEQANAYLTVVIFGNTAGIENPAPDQLPGKEALEQIAQALNLEIQPNKMNREAVLAGMETEE